MISYQTCYRIEEIIIYLTNRGIDFINELTKIVLYNNIIIMQIQIAKNCFKYVIPIN